MSTRHYSKAGVDVKKVRDSLSAALKDTINTSLFAGIYPIDFSKYKDPVLISSTDGVGTKLLLAAQFNMFSGIAQDLFAMVINDLAAAGATPLFFLDYIASNKIDTEVLNMLLNSMKHLCSKYGISLLGGETAEMPGFYSNERVYDLAGFGVGIAEKEEASNAGSAQSGDVLIGLSSSGPHSNGFSLIRGALEDSILAELKQQIMMPTKIYLDIIQKLRERIELKGMYHITGGGLPENILRLTDKNYNVHLDLKGYELPSVFKEIMNRGEISLYDMFSVFNMGFGFVIAVSPQDVASALMIAEENGDKARVIGRFVQGTGIMTIETRDRVMEFVL